MLSLVELVFDAFVQLVGYVPVPERPARLRKLILALYVILLAAFVLAAGAGLVMLIRSLT